MKLDWEEREGMLVATPRCESFARFGAEDYRECFGPLLDRIRGAAVTVILDLGEVDYMRSSGLGVILALREEIRRLGGELRVASPPVLCRNVFRASGVTRNLPVFDSIEEALRPGPE